MADDLKSDTESMLENLKEQVRFDQLPVVQKSSYLESDIQSLLKATGALSRQSPD